VTFVGSAVADFCVDLTLVRQALALVQLRLLLGGVLPQVGRASRSFVARSRSSARCSRSSAGRWRSSAWPSRISASISRWSVRVSRWLMSQSASVMPAL
jgi:hypothetical protein